MTDTPQPETSPLSAAEKRALKAAAQTLEPAFAIGRAGVTDQLITQIQASLKNQSPLKIRIEAHKEQRHELATEIATRTQAHLVQVIGHVIVLARR